MVIPLEELLLDDNDLGDAGLRCLETSVMAWENSRSTPIESMCFITSLHLPYKSTKCRQVHHTWMVWDIESSQNLSKLGGDLCFYL